MSNDRIETVFTEALARPTPEARDAYLTQACAGDSKLRARVEDLLASHQVAGNLLPPPLGELPEQVKIGEGPGSKIGRYKLLEQIGEGGFGVVFMAEQAHPVRRRVALKIVKLGMDTREVVTRFEAERQALAMMDHPNIAKVLDGGATDTGRPYFVMELVRGTPISAYCNNNRLDTRHRLELFLSVCSAVQHAHQKGIIHRDLKPNNVLVTVQDGVAVPKVIDFGIAKATQGRLTDGTLFTGFRQMIGTPAYMSPEQADMSWGEDVDTRSDVYSLGVLLYELLVGTTPFDVTTFREAALGEVQRIIREVEPPSPSNRLRTLSADERTTVARQRQCDPERLYHGLRGDLDWVVMRCLEKDRRRRYDTASALAEDVHRFLEDEPVQARPPTALYRARKFVRRNRLAVAAAVLVAGALLLGIAGTTLGLVRANVQRTLADQRFKEAEHARREEATQRQRAERNEGLAQARQREADQQAARSQQIASLLTDLLAGAKFSTARGRDTTLIREVLARAEKRIGSALKDQPDLQADMLLTLAGTYSDIDDMEHGERLYRRALALRRSIHQGDHRELARTLEREAYALYILSFGDDNPARHLSRAEPLAREAVAMRRRLAEPSGYELARTMSTLGAILLEENRAIEAERIFREIIAMHIDRGPSFSMSGALANALRKQGRFAEAIPLHEEELRKREGQPGALVGGAVWGFTDTLVAAGDAKRAEALLKQSLAAAQKIYPPDHVVVRATVGRLMSIYVDQGRQADAKALEEQWQAAVRLSASQPTPEELLAEDPETALFTSPPLPRMPRKPDVAPAGHDGSLPLDPAEAADVLARRGDFVPAIAELRSQLSEHRGDTKAMLQLAALLAWSGEQGEYAEHCGDILRRTAEFPQDYVVRRIAKACLLAPLPSEATETAAQLADRSLTLSDTGVLQMHAQLLKGLAEYRRKNYQAAIEWTEKGMKGPADQGALITQEAGLSVIAMAQYKLGRQAEARQTLARAAGAQEARWLSGSRKSLGGAWPDVVMAQVLLREAQSVVGAK